MTLGLKCQVAMLGAMARKMISLNFAKGWYEKETKTIVVVKEMKERNKKYRH